MSDADIHDVQKMTCIGCPLGCQLEVELQEGTAWRIEGYGCKKGKTYAAQEVTDPRRMLTTTVTLRGAQWPRLPVRSLEPVPKDRVVEICRRLHELALEAPIAMGQVVLADALDTGIDVIATRSLGIAAE